MATLKTAAQRHTDRLDGMVMDALGQRIATREPRHKALGQRLDDADFQRQPAVGDLAGKGS